MLPEITLGTALTGLWWGETDLTGMTQHGQGRELRTMEGLGWWGLGRWGGFLKEEVLELGLEEEGEVGGRWAQKVPGLRPGGEGAWNSRGWLVCSVLPWHCPGSWAPPSQAGRKEGFHWLHL